MKKVLSSLVILGGGPAGCAAALSAHQEGFKDITIIEKEPYGRHRIGEILLTSTILEFNKLGIAQEMSDYAKKLDWGRKFAAAYVHGQDRTPWRVQNNHPLSAAEDQPHIPRCFVDPKTNLWYTLMVRRHEFDEALREICKNRGVQFIHGSVKDFKLVQEESLESSQIIYLNVECLNKEIIQVYPQFVIDATGQQAFVSRKMKTRQIIDDWNLQARYTYFKGVNFDKAKEHALLQEGANILSFEDGWSWVAYLGKGITSVGIVSKYWDKDEKHFWKKLSNLPESKIFEFDKASVIDCFGQDAAPDHLYVHPNYRFRSQVMRGKNWSCAGDAAMFLDPLLSQGVTLALSYGAEIGRIAVQICHDEVEAITILKKYEKHYINEIEILNKVVSQWYLKDFTFEQKWAETAQKITKIFGRDIQSNVEAFRWVSNLENIHNLFNHQSEKNILPMLNDVNTIKMIHDFEKSQNLIL